MERQAREAAAERERPIEWMCKARGNQVYPILEERCVQTCIASDRLRILEKLKKEREAVRLFITIQTRKAFAAYGRESIQRL